MEISPLVGLMTKAVGHLKCPLMHDMLNVTEILALSICGHYGLKLLKRPSPNAHKQVNV